MSGHARYLPHGPFHTAVHARVDAYFAASGKSPHESIAMRSKTVIIFAWLIGSYCYCLLGANTWWQVGLSAMSIGLAMAGIGFNVQHDGGHRAYSCAPWVNGMMAGSLDFIGASSYIWAWKHNVLHHSNPNCAGLDADIDIQPFCRLSPSQKSHPWQRFQHVYIWFLYSFLASKWLFDDFRDLILGAVGGQKFPRPKGWALVQMLAGKAFFICWSMVLPMMLHSPLHVFLAWGVASITISISMAAVFQMAHVVEGVSFPDIEVTGVSRWAEHQVESAADFAQGNRLMSWYMGGLNFQIEHHLFPKLCHVHLPAIAPIVRDTCAEFGVRYQVHTTMFDALRSHVRWLKILGTQPKPATSDSSGTPSASRATAS